MARPKSTGVCKLTHNHGTFVDSHLLPKALTRPDVAGNFLIENGYSHRPTKRFSSWYDPELCIRKGENILAAYDNDGIKELRRLKLIWSGWAGLNEYIGPDFIPFSQPFMPGHGLCVLTDTKAKTLRMFVPLVARSSYHATTVYRCSLGTGSAGALARANVDVA
jgi:hypothetical protein